MSSSALPIAVTPDALSPEWLTAALGSPVRAVSASPIGTGQMCDCYRLTLDDGVELPTSLVAKLPAADETSRATARALHLYESEVAFYQELAPVLPVRTPRVYYADQDVEATTFVLLLEDLAPAEPGDQLRGCSADEAAIALAELVRLHAPRWGDPSLRSIGWLHREADPAGEDPMVSVLPLFWERFVERYDGTLPADVEAAGDALFANLATYTRADTEPWTIVHGDYRLDNLLFDPEVPSVTVVDWQRCAHGAPLTDVAYFTGAGLVTETRRAVERDLVRAYLDQLHAAGVASYSWDRCWLEYRRGSWLGLIIAVASATLVERTPRGDELFLTMATRHARHALDLEAGKLLTG
jgi:hypothetical protein